MHARCSSVDCQQDEVSTTRPTRASRTSAASASASSNAPLACCWHAPRSALRSVPASECHAGQRGAGGRGRAASERAVKQQQQPEWRGERRWQWRRRQTTTTTTTSLLNDLDRLPRPPLARCHRPRALYTAAPRPCASATCASEGEITSVCQLPVDRTARNPAWWLWWCRLLLVGLVRIGGSAPRRLTLTARSASAPPASAATAACERHSITGPDRERRAVPHAPLRGSADQQQQQNSAESAYPTSLRPSSPTSTPAACLPATQPAERVAPAVRRGRGREWGFRTAVECTPSVVASYHAHARNHVAR